VVRRVDRRPWIEVVPPGAADVVGAFDDGERDAEIEQALAEDDACGAGADDQRVSADVLRLPPRPVHGPVGEPEIFPEHRCVALVDPLGHAPPHHLDHEIVPRIVDRRFDGAVGEQLHRGGADLVRHVGWESGVLLGDEADVAPRLERRCQPLPVTRHLEQAHQQDPQVGVGQRGRQVVTVEGLEGGAHDRVESTGIASVRTCRSPFQRAALA
jgi:hypothetical protein